MYAQPGGRYQVSFGDHKHRRADPIEAISTLRTQPTALVELLQDAFGASPQLPRSCWIRGALSENQTDFSPAIEVAVRAGAHRDLVRRLREEHPLRRTHRLNHDRGLLNFFTEVEAFAWSVEIARLPQPRFVTSPGSPDLSAGDWWIEAKTINKSDAPREYDERVMRPLLESGGIVMRGPATLAHPLPGLIDKFQADLGDGLRKWDRQNRTGQLAMFYDWVNVDFGISKADARRAVGEWAVRSEKATDA